MIYENITREQYDQLEGVNWSKLKHFTDSIKHGYYMLNAQYKDTPAMREGRAIHTLVLEPHKFNNDYVIGGPVNPKTGKTYGSTSQKFQDWLLEQGTNKTYLSDDEATKVNTVAKKVKTDNLAGKVLRDSDLKEFALTWTDKETGIKCKCLIDFGSRNQGYIGDLKSISADLNYDRLSKELYSRQYYGQFAFYESGANANGLNINEFKVIWVQSVDEMDVAVSTIGAQTAHYGQMLFSKCLKNYREAQNGNTPGYHINSFVLDVPYWSMDEFMSLEESGLLFEEVI